MGLIFNRTPAGVKAAEKALQRGDAFHHVFVDYGQPDPDLFLNQVAAAGWELAQWHIVHDAGKIWGVYLFRHPQQGAPRP